MLGGGGLRGIQRSLALGRGNSLAGGDTTEQFYAAEEVPKGMAPGGPPSHKKWRLLFSVTPIPFCHVLLDRIAGEV